MTASDPLGSEAARWLRRAAVLAAGLVLIGLGVLLLALPGPGLVTIAAGLGVLSTEFATLARWRRSLFARLRGAPPESERR